MLFDLVRSNYTFGQNLIIIVVFVLAILMALILHEVAHGFAALKCGDPSAKLAGRLSLNPVKHLDPLGTICMLIAGIGWAKPVPVNPFNYRNFRKGNFWVSIAGVTANLILAVVFSLCYFLLYKYALISNIWIFALYYFFYFGTVVNVALMIFNLIPVYPFDGFNMLVSFTKPDNRYMQFVRQNSILLVFAVLALVSFTGLLGTARNGIITGFLWFWELMF